MKILINEKDKEIESLRLRMNPVMVDSDKIYRLKVQLQDYKH
jgi:hypothetical protein